MNLAGLPHDFQFARDQLHQVAFYALSPARYAVEERMGLEATTGGFGTPEFAGRVARVEGNLLVHEQAGNVATQTITTIRAAAAFFGVEYDEAWFTDFRDPLPPMDPDRPLAIDSGPALALADWFRFGFDILARLQPMGGDEDDVSTIQLWPEHFDAAIEMGSEGEGRRASYGASPGDREHIEPYVYVSAWSAIDRANPYWNDRHFNGASYPYALLVEAADPAGAALDFFTEGFEVLHR